VDEYDEEDDGHFLPPPRPPQPTGPPCAKCGKPSIYALQAVHVRTKIGAPFTKTAQDWCNACRFNYSWAWRRPYTYKRRPKKPPGG